jgi:fructose-bisphosphate aldolase class 1
MNKIESPYDVTGAIIAFECGELEEDAVIELFQHLVDTGLAWSLQGSYGRAARSLIDAGLVEA